MPARKNPKKPKASRPHMPEYGLPAGQKGLLAWSWAEQRLKKSHNYWISTCRPDGSPHCMVVWGLWREGGFYFSTGKKSRKARNLERNPRCVVCSERAEEAVVVEGTAKLLVGKARPEWFVAEYQKKYAWDMSEFGEPVYVVRPRVVFGLYEKNFVGSATRWRF